MSGKTAVLFAVAVIGVLLSLTTIRIGAKKMKEGSTQFRFLDLFDGRVGKESSGTQLVVEGVFGIFGALCLFYVCFFWK